MPNVDIGQAISQSFQYIGTAWSKAWGVMLIVVWLTAALGAIQSLRPEWTFIPLFGLLLNTFAATAMVGALFRIGIEPRHPGDAAFRANAAGLQWGALEWRVLGANWIVGIIMGLAAAIVGVIWAIVVGVTAAADLQGLGGADPGQAMLRLLTGSAGLATLVIVLLAAPAFLYFGARLSLYSLIAADERAFGFAPTWTLTRGAVRAIIVTWVVAGLAELVLFFIAGALGGIVAGAAGQGAGAATWGGIAAQTVGAAVSGPIAAGLQLYIYRTRKQGDDVAATFA